MTTAGRVQLEALAQEARKFKTAEEFVGLLDEKGPRVISGNEKLAIVLGRPTKFSGRTFPNDVIRDLQKIGFSVEKDITGGINVIILDNELTNFLKENPQKLTDFYNQVIKEIPVVAPSDVPIEAMAKLRAP